MPTIRINRAAMAVLEECRRDRWSDRPQEDAGEYVLNVDEVVFKLLQRISRPGDTYSDVLLRAYRQGGGV